MSNVVGTANAPATSGPPPLIRNRDFQALWISRFLAGLGKETGEVAYPLLTLAMTGSATYAGIIGASQVITASLTSVPGGVLGDRFSRVRLLTVYDLARAGLLGAFAVLIFTGNVSIPVVLALSMCSSACLGLSNPIALAAIKQLVHPSQVSTAAAQNQIRFFTSTMLGSPIAGFLFGIGRAFPFMAEAASYLLSVLVLRIIRPTRPAQSSPDTTPGWNWQGVTDGFRFIAGHPIIRPMMTWITGFNMAFTHTGAFIAIIAVANSRGASSSQIGLTISIAGLSGVVGALIAGGVIRWLPPSAVLLVAAWIAPVGAILMAIVPGTVALGVILGCVFAMVPCTNSLLFGYLAAVVPNHLQGRVMGAISFLSFVAQPIGIFGIGALFDAAGPKWVFIAMASVAGVAALPTLTRHMRRLPRPEAVAVD